MPLLVTSKEGSLIPSDTILSFTLIVSFKKDLLLCSIAIFNLTPFKKDMESI